MKTPYEKEWFDDDSFWQEFYPFMFSNKRFPEAEKQVDKVLALTKPAGTTALDLSCGPGRCTIALAKREFSMTGVDRTKFLLNKAQERADAAQVNINWIQEDMRKFVRPGAFALVLNMFTSFGYFDNKANDLAVLENMFRSLRYNGICLIDVMS
ncbi:class I SAM-dependent methyltransferase [Nitrospira sp. Ecomares 2.1]